MQVERRKEWWGEVDADADADAEANADADADVDADADANVDLEDGTTEVMAKQEMEARIEGVEDECSVQEVR